MRIQLHLALAFEAGYLIGEKPVPAALVESVLSRQLGDLKPTLTRHGYRVEQFDAKSAEVKALFSNFLELVRAATVRDKMLAAALSI
ncbi:phosphoribulokinase [Paraburkholderia aspalathi]|nr:phosphoribulokinase [Paraburkholderia aspalathi]